MRSIPVCKGFTYTVPISKLQLQDALEVQILCDLGECTQHSRSQDRKDNDDPPPLV